MIPPVDLPIAHLSEDGRSQPLSEHLRNVAEKASKFAADFRAANWGYAAGLLHDDGKALVEFQKRIRGASIQVDHSTPGARFAVEEYGIPRGYGRLLAYCVAGHHTGLPDGADNGKQSSLEYRLAHSRLGEGYLAGELPVTLENPPIGRPPVSAEKRGFDASFFIRMLYSCLVDADFLDTESFFEPHRVALRGRGPALETLKGFLEDHLRTIAASASPTEVNRLRARILAECRASALLAPGLFSLTVPTGGGKTLSSMAFALDHAIRHGLRRVIYVIPYTSIIEQTARVFRDVFGADAVLEHHSNFVQESDDSDDEREQRRRLAAENWDAPVVVTTNVQFFESFFACRSSKARKLHNVAASVVILDEAQMLPVSVLSPTLEVIRELVEGYGSSVVLCTATQPALMAREEFKGGLTGAREMMGAPLDLEKAFRRVNEVNLGETGDAELVRRIREARECLCVVNTKKHARELFRTLEDQPGTFHLSAAMCPVHRSRVLGKAKDPEPGSIREALLEGKPCRVISTQLVEAGVDLDFPVVFRALAGVDSIVQAAGRCNREGKLADGGTLYIFSPEESAPPGYLRQSAQATESVLRSSSGNVLDSATVHAYFEELYWAKAQGGGLDSPGILSVLATASVSGNFPFRELADAYQLIPDAQIPVIVPFDEKASGLCAELRNNADSRDLLRQLQPYTVQVYPRGLANLIECGDVESIQDGRYYFLSELGMKNSYSRDFGLIPNGRDYNDPDDLTV